MHVTYHLPCPSRASVTELLLLPYYATQVTFYYDGDDANISLARVHSITMMLEGDRARVAGRSAD
jgi:hypothetical protein